MPDVPGLLCRGPADHSRRPVDEDMLKLRIESGDAAVSASRWDEAVYIAAGYDPFELAEKAVCQAAALSGGAKPRQTKVLPPTLDVFGWCTWDAFYSRVSGFGILHRTRKEHSPCKGTLSLQRVGRETISAHGKQNSISQS